MAIPHIYNPFADGEYDFESDEYYPLMLVAHDVEGKPIWGKMDYNTYETSVAYMEKADADEPYS